MSWHGLFSWNKYWLLSFQMSETPLFLFWYVPKHIVYFIVSLTLIDMIGLSCKMISFIQNKKWERVINQDTDDNKNNIFCSFFHMFQCQPDDSLLIFNDLWMYYLLFCITHFNVTKQTKTRGKTWSLFFFFVIIVIYWYKRK